MLANKNKQSILDKKNDKEAIERTLGIQIYLARKLIWLLSDIYDVDDDDNEKCKQSEIQFNNVQSNLGWTNDSANT